jgi:RNA polymerase sigma-70 factor, ECF subfamily
MRTFAGQLDDRLLTVTTADDAAGLERDFEERLAESSRLAFRVAFSVLRHREDAEDVAQEAFAKAHRSFSRLRDRERFRAWLVRTTWRTALDRQRSDRRHARLDHADWEARGLGAVPPTPADALDAAERSRRLWKAIDALPEKLRIVIVLVNIEDHDLNEVARLVGAPVGTIKWRLFVARRKLKSLLQ